MTSVDLLAAARDLLERPGLSSVGSWPRAVALLTRQALEKGLEEFWATSPETAGLRVCSKKSQLICLPTYLNRSISWQINYVWAALTSACHYHPYELAPTVGELNGWLETIQSLLNAIEDKVPGALAAR
jgi:hypothetical protein